ncbi:MAG: acetyltransferase [Rhodobacteraceae bacterium]|nr:acetyltransferase [Paracoccaceae bacterium]
MRVAGADRPRGGAAGSRSCCEVQRTPDPGRDHFRAATDADLDLLRRWLEAPHVRRWWAAETPFDVGEPADARVCRWIVSLEGRPFACMQDHAVHGWGQHRFDDLPGGSRGIDQFIGEPGMIGRGHGTGFIRQRMTELFGAGVPVVATDPHPENARAIAVCRRLGFAIAGPARQTEWGLVLPMEARPGRGERPPGPRS